MIKKISILIVFFCGFFTFGNEVIAYLEKIQANYKDLNSFQAVLDYKIYKGYKGNEAAEFYQSQFYGSGKSTYRKMGDDILIISKDDIMMTLTKSTQTIVLSEPTTIEFEQVDFASALKVCSDLKVEMKGDHRIVHLAFKTGQSNPYTKLSIEIDKNFFIKKIIIYYAQKLNFSKDYSKKEMNFPRLEIAYTSFSKRWRDIDKVIDLTPYVKKDNEGFKVTDNYKNYELIDLRSVK